MQLKLEQLSTHLRRGLVSTYVISGDESLQLIEAGDVIRRSAWDVGFTERIVFHADNRFDWGIVGQCIDSLSLFAEKRLLDIRLPSGKIGPEGTEVLVRYASRSNSDQIVLVSTGQLNARQRNAKWYKSLEKAGVAITIWPVNSRDLPRWINTRARDRGMRITTEAAEMLADRVEGNLFACAQEIEKFILLFGDAREIDVPDVLECVMDNAHFDTFSLVDSTLMGNASHTVRILLRLAEEDTDPLPILGVLAWEIREVARVSGDVARGARLEQAIGRQSVWYRRRKAVESALRRHDWTAWIKMLRAAEDVDRIIKGVKKGDPWTGLLGLALRIVGVKLDSTSALAFDESGISEKSVQSTKSPKP
uniref:DNA polymerase III subunit delta n=1 Tax=Candidatus Kentrum sp. SD TaxID=2126332 RepID=A0A451BJ81_9GAMM|nr:MAG: DNA polymerase III, delta subunit [Candidatus Kentron sp. SD]